MLVSTNVNKVAAGGEAPADPPSGLDTPSEFAITPQILSDFGSSVWSPTVAKIGSDYYLTLRGNLLISGAYPQSIMSGPAASLAGLAAIYPTDMTTLRGGYNPNRLYQHCLIHDGTRFVNYCCRTSTSGATATHVYRMEKASDPMTNAWTNSVLVLNSTSDFHHYTGVGVKFDGVNWVMAAIKWYNSATAAQLTMMTSPNGYDSWTQVGAHTMTGLVALGYTADINIVNASTQEVWLGSGDNLVKVFTFSNRNYGTFPTLSASLSLGGASRYFGGMHIEGGVEHAIYTVYPLSKAFAAPITR